MPNEKNDKREPVDLKAITKAALTRTAITYPFEKVSKKLQDNKEPLTKFVDFKRVVLGDHLSKPLISHNHPFRNSSQIAKELYKGAMPWGFAYKGVQLTTLALFKPLQEEMTLHFNNPITANFASSGIMTCIQTPVLQFLSNMKVLNQAGTPPQFYLFAHNANPIKATPALSFIGNPKFFRDLGSFGQQYVFKNTWITGARNFSFFTPFSIARSQAEKYFSHSGERKLTTGERVISSAIGSASGLACSFPFDVIKTRKQLLPLGFRMSSFQIFKTTVEKEGVGALTKGLGPNCATELVGLILFFSLQEWFSNKKEEIVEKKPTFFATQPKELYKERLESNDVPSEEEIRNSFSRP